MNEINARSVPVYDGFHGVSRKVHKAGWEKVSEGGTPRVYETEDEAEVAAWRAALAPL